MNLKKLKKKIIFVFALALFISPILSSATLAAGDSNPNLETLSFKAKVVEIIAEEEKEREIGGTYTQQDLRVEALEGERKGEKFIYRGITQIEVSDSNVYKLGDKAFVDVYGSETGEETVYLTGYDRSLSMYILIALFALVFIIIGKGKGFKSLLSLIVSFVIILKFILPQILAGRDPFIVSLIGGLLIMAAIIYFTEGWKKKSHLAILAVLISLSVTLLLSVIFTNFARLSGMSQDETVFLIDLVGATINFKGLLLAGMLIGAIGVLDDIIIGQLETVERIKEANPVLSPKRVFKLSYKIGNTHLGTMVNTLFLTYAGAALPLLLIFTIGAKSGLDLSRNLNSELITTEVVRTLVGSIGVMLAMPISTFLGAYGLRRVDEEK